MEQRLRDRQPERLGRLEVDHQLELGGLLDGEVSGLGAFEDLVHINSGTPKQIGEIRAIRHQASSLDKLPQLVHCWDSVLGCQIRDAASFVEEHGAWEQYKDELRSITALQS